MKSLTSSQVRQESDEPMQQEETFLHTLLMTSEKGAVMLASQAVLV